MIKTNIKMRVTPEQKRKIQQIIPRVKEYPNHIDFIYIRDNGYSWGKLLDEFKNSLLEEIDPELFIRTNGTCVEKREEKMKYNEKLEILKEWEDTAENSFAKKIENPNLATDKEIEQVINEEYEKDNSINNGGKTDYYQLENAPFPINDFDDFAEWRGLNGNQFNMGKVMWTFNTGRHIGTDYERDLNKIIHYANRELLRLKRAKK